jgi:hypothetical protein
MYTILYSVARVREWTIPTERPQYVICFAVKRGILFCRNNVNIVCRTIACTMIDRMTNCAVCTGHLALVGCWNLEDCDWLDVRLDWRRRFRTEGFGTVNSLENRLRRPKTITLGLCEIHLWRMEAAGNGIMYLRTFWYEVESSVILPQGERERTYCH